MSHATVPCLQSQSYLKMNIARARTDALANFAEFHSGLNRVIKVVGASFALTERVTTGINGARILEAFIRSAKQPWGTSNHYSSPATVLVHAKSEASVAFAFRVYSTMEHFLTEAGAFIDRHRIGPLSSSPTSIAAEDATEAGPLVDFVIRHKSGIRLSDADIRTLKFFWALRNSLAHRGGIISKQMVDMIKDPAVLVSLIHQSTKVEPLLKQQFSDLKEGRLIELDLWVPIFVSSVYYRILSDIDRELVNECGGGALIVSACERLDASRSFGSASAARPKSFNKAVFDILNRRYFARDVGDAEIAKLVHSSQIVAESKRRFDADCEKYLDERRRKKDERRRHGTKKAKIGN